VCEWEDASTDVVVACCYLLPDAYARALLSSSQWRDPTELYGIGKYAADAYHMFCRGR